MKTGFNRRKFLQDAGKTASLAAYMYGLDNLMSLLFRQSLAHADDASYPYKYVNIMTPNGPPRWYFDLPLNPSGKAADFNPGAFGTELRQVSGSWVGDYQAYPVKFGAGMVHMPPLWNLTSAGTGISFASLLENTIMMRGLNMEIDSHGVNRERTVRPVSTEPSISGLVADQSSSPSPSIGFSSSDATNVFKSASSIGGVVVASNNPVPGVIGPFKVEEIVKYDSLDFSVRQALGRIDRHVASAGLSSYGSEANLKRTYDMFARNLTAFQARYTGLLTKYQAIVQKEFRAEMPNVTEYLQKIVPDNTAVFSVSQTNTLKTSNLKAHFDASGPATGIAPAFAFIEFALTENLTASLTVDVGGAASSPINGAGVSNDQHFVGTVMSVLLTSTFYRGIMGCMTELKKSLGVAGIFDKTVIQFASEFSRTPVSDNAGTDHGFTANSTSIFSGMITPAQSGLVGNVHKLAPDLGQRARIPGTWGVSAPITHSDGKRRDLVLDDVVATICEMLEVKPLGTKGVSLIRNDGGKAILLTKEAKNV